MPFAFRFLFISIAVVVLCFNTDAFAVLSFNQAITSLQAQSDVAGSATYIIECASAIDYYDLDGSVDVSSGDVILGAFVVEEIRLGQDSIAYSAPYYLSGIFAFEVSDTVGIGNHPDPTIAKLRPISPEADAMMAARVGSAGAPSMVLDPAEMFAFYQGGFPVTHEINTANPAPFSFYQPQFHDGDAYASFEAEEDFGMLFFLGHLGAIQGLPPRSQIGHSGSLNTNEFFPIAGLSVRDGGENDGGEGISQLPLVPAQLLPNYEVVLPALTMSTSGFYPSTIGDPSDAYFVGELIMEVGVAPEPGSLCLLVIGGIVLAHPRRQHQML